jgi:hypothetical protein
MTRHLVLLVDETCLTPCDASILSFFFSPSTNILSIDMMPIWIWIGGKERGNVVLPAPQVVTDVSGQPRMLK